ncbi:hypothetical protein RA210_U390008 [Rubrivivax sp. A210]|nr:hypothetical protein RA210_U390008 [Rubrivivax sp. A210]
MRAQPLWVAYIFPENGSVESFDPEGLHL